MESSAQVTVKRLTSKDSLVESLLPVFAVLQVDEEGRGISWRASRATFTIKLEVFILQIDGFGVPGQSAFMVSADL